MLKTNYDGKIKDIEDKMPSITNLATTGALNAVENKIPNVSTLIKKTDYDAKISDIEEKMFYYFGMSQIYKSYSRCKDNKKS